MVLLKATSAKFLTVIVDGLQSSLAVEQLKTSYIFLTNEPKLCMKCRKYEKSYKTYKVAEHR
jgi:hypothetical protein